MRTGGMGPWRRALAALLLAALLPGRVAAQAPAYLGQWGAFGNGNGQFYYPYGVAIGANGNVYVSDQANHRIQRFTAGGTYMSQWGSYGYGDGQFRSPSGMAADAGGNV